MNSKRLPQRAREGGEKENDGDSSEFAASMNVQDEAAGEKCPRAMSPLAWAHGFTCSALRKAASNEY